MQKQLGYKQEEKPSAVILILFSIMIVFCLIAVYFYFFSFDTETFFKTVLLLIACIAVSYAWYKAYKKHKGAIAAHDVIFKEGKKYKGHIIKTEISTHTEVRYHRHHHMSEEVTVYEYYAVIEYINDKGETIQFTTPEITGNPEYLSTKEVTVYNMDSVNYATDFGYDMKPEKKITFKMDE